MRVKTGASNKNSRPGERGFPRFPREPGPAGGRFCFRALFFRERLGETSRLFPNEAAQEACPANERAQKKITRSPRRVRTTKERRARKSLATDTLKKFHCLYLRFRSGDTNVTDCKVLDICPEDRQKVLRLTTFLGVRRLEQSRVKVVVPSSSLG